MPPENSGYPSDKVLSYKELITEKLNKWRDLLIERAASYHEAMYRFRENPKLVLKTQNGQRMSIKEIVSVRIPALIEARANVKTLEGMLAEAQNAESDLEGRWADEGIIDPEVDESGSVPAAALE